MRVRKALVIPAVLVGVVLTPGIASAQPQPHEEAHPNQGAGVCVSQIAIMPELLELGVTNLGQAARVAARQKFLVEYLDTLRDECGNPPGPGHLPR
jgi:hypothetical protein